MKIPKINLDKINPSIFKIIILKISITWKRKIVLTLTAILLCVFFGFLAGSVFTGFHFEKINSLLEKIKIELPQKIQSKIINENKEYSPATTQEEATIKAVKEASPAVVSIIITKDLPVVEQYFTNPFGDIFGENSPFSFQVPQYRQKGTEKKEIGGGSGFIVSTEGLILTNKHVVLDKEAEYTVLTNDGSRYPAKVLALDPIQDLAVIKIEAKDEVDEQGLFYKKLFPYVKIGDSDNLQIGQFVIAIGNALGEFRNTVSVGVVSGLGRTVTASGGTFTETIEDVIQTDAAINPGNSGGPLLNLRGEVIGINTATVSGAQSIGFAIPINKAKRDIESIKTLGKIVYPFLGVRYTLINETIKEKNKLSVDYGAWIQKGENGEMAITLGSAAEEAGLKEGDIVLELNGEKITQDNSLAKIIQKYNPGDRISIKYLRDNEEVLTSTTLKERTE